MHKNLWIALLFVVAFGACKKDEPSVTTDQDLLISNWLEERNLTATRAENGIYYYRIEENAAGDQVGQGGDVLAFYYQLFDLEENLLAGFQRSDGDSLLAKTGASAFFPIGLDGLFSVMREGEKYAFLIPASAGYGEVASLNTSDGSNVVRLEVQLVGLFSESDIDAIESNRIQTFIAENDLDSVEIFGSGIAYQDLILGNEEPVQNGVTLVVSYSLSHLDGGIIFSNESITYVLGSGFPSPLIPGLEFGLSLLSPGERGLIIIPSSQAYRESAQIIPSSIVQELIESGIVPAYVADITPYKTLVFDVTRNQ